MKIKFQFEYNCCICKRFFDVEVKLPLSTSSEINSVPGKVDLEGFFECSEVWEYDVQHLFYHPHLSKVSYIEKTEIFKKIYEKHDISIDDNELCVNCKNSLLEEVYELLEWDVFGEDDEGNLLYEERKK